MYLKSVLPKTYPFLTLKPMGLSLTKKIRSLFDCIFKGLIIIDSIELVLVTIFKCLTSKIKFYVPYAGYKFWSRVPNAIFKMQKAPMWSRNETLVRKTYRNFLLSVLNCVTEPLSKYRYHFKLNYLIIKLVFLKNVVRRYTAVLISKRRGSQRLFKFNQNLKIVLKIFWNLKTFKNLKSFIKGWKFDSQMLKKVNENNWNLENLRS